MWEVTDPPPRANNKDSRDCTPYNIIIKFFHDQDHVKNIPAIYFSRRRRQRIPRKKNSYCTHPIFPPRRYPRAGPRGIAINGVVTRVDFEIIFDENWIF